MNFKDLFLKGKEPFNYLFSLNGFRTITQNNRFSPLSKDWHRLEYMVNTNPIAKKCSNIWQSVGDYYDLEVKVEISQNKDRNETIKKRIQKIVDKEFSPVIKKLIQILSEKGNAYLMLDDEGKLTAQHPDFFNLYWNASNQRPYFYKFIVDGAEQPQELQHGEEIWHIRNPFSQAQTLGTAPIESAYTISNAFQIIFSYIEDEFAKGLTGNVLATLKKDNNGNHTRELLKDGSNGTPKWTEFSKNISNWFGRVRGKKNESAGVITLPFVDQFFKYGGNLKDMEANPSLDKMINLIANSFNLNAQDVGFGNTNHSNIKEFAEQQEEKVGKPIKKVLEDALNIWFLPIVKGISTSYTTNTQVWCEFEAPQNEDEQAKRTQMIDLLKFAPLTDQEKRQILVEHFDLNIIPEEFETESQTVEGEVLEPSNTSESESQEPEPENTNFSLKFEKKSIVKEIQKNSIQDKALSSFYFSREERNSKGEKVKKGFLAHLENALNKQIQRTAEKMKKNKSLDVKKNLVKLESVLPFNVLNSDLQNFGDFSKTETEKEITKYYKTGKVKQKIGFALSKAVQEYFEARTKILLQGYASLTDEEKEIMQASWQDKAYKGLDEETITEIQNLINANLEKPLDEIIQIILSSSEDITQRRAKLIAEAEVVNAVERVRFETYKENEFKFKKHLTVNDSRVVDISKQAEAEGIVPIDHVYNHVIGDGLASPLHFGERGSEVYGITKEDLE